MRRPRRTNKPPASKLKPAKADEGSISGATKGFGLGLTGAEQPGNHGIHEHIGSFGAADAAPAVIISAMVKLTCSRIIPSLAWLSTP
jgi:hypothetical protein